MFTFLRHLACLSVLLGALLSAPMAQAHFLNDANLELRRTADQPGRLFGQFSYHSFDFEVLIFGYHLHKLATLPLERLTSTNAPYLNLYLKDVLSVEMDGKISEFQITGVSSNLVDYSPVTLLDFEIIVPKAVTNMSLTYLPSEDEDLEFTLFGRFVDGVAASSFRITESNLETTFRLDGPIGTVASSGLNEELVKEGEAGSIALPVLDGFGKTILFSLIHFAFIALVLGREGLKPVPDSTPDEQTTKVSPEGGMTGLFKLAGWGGLFLVVGWGFHLLGLTQEATLIWMLACCAVAVSAMMKNMPELFAWAGFFCLGAFAGDLGFNPLDVQQLIYVGIGLAIGLLVAILCFVIGEKAALRKFTDPILLILLAGGMALLFFQTK